MIKYLDSVLQEFLGHLGATTFSPYGDYLFKICYKIEMQHLTEYQAKTFHNTVPQLLLVSASARQSVHISVGFLATRVTKPDKEEWVKLKRVFKYLKVKRKLNLSPSFGDMSVSKW